MSDKWHINNEGNPGRCSASTQPCPFGLSEDEHYNTKDEARVAYEKEMQNVPELAFKSYNRSVVPEEKRTNQIPPMSFDEEEMFPEDSKMESSYPPSEYANKSYEEIKDEIDEYEAYDPDSEAEWYEMRGLPVPKKDYPEDYDFEGLMREQEENAAAYYGKYDPDIYDY